MRCIPFEEQIQQKSLTLTKSSSATLNVLVNSAAANATSNSGLSLSQAEVGITGMTESGPSGLITYQSSPPRVNLQENASSESDIQLKTQDNAKPGSYTAMVRVQVPEQDGLVISRLYPVKIVLDVPQPQANTQTGEPSGSNAQISALFEIRDVIRYVAIAAAVGLAGYIVYRRVKRKPIQS